MSFKRREVVSGKPVWEASERRPATRGTVTLVFAAHLHISLNPLPVINKANREKQLSSPTKFTDSLKRLFFLALAISGHRESRTVTSESARCLPDVKTRSIST